MVELPDAAVGSADRSLRNAGLLGDTPDAGSTLVHLVIMTSRPDHDLGRFRRVLDEPLDFAFDLSAEHVSWAEASGMLAY